MAQISRNYELTQKHRGGRKNFDFSRRGDSRVFFTDSDGCVHSLTAQSINAFEWAISNGWGGCALGGCVLTRG